MKLSSAAEASLPSTPGRAGRWPRRRRGRPARRRRARSRRPRAPRRRGGRRCAGRHPRSARRAARRPAAPEPGGRPKPASSAATDWSKRRPPGASRYSGRGGSTSSTAPKTGSGASTMPAPPPKGASSTLRCGSVAAGAEVVHAQVDEPVASRPADDARGAVRIDDLGEDREHVDAQAGPLRRHSNSPGGTSTTTRPASRPTTNLSGTRLPSSITEVARRVRLHGDHDAVARAVGLDDLAADQLVHEEGTGVLDGRGEQQGAAELIGGFAGVRRPRTQTRWRPWKGLDAAHLRVITAGDQRAPGTWQVSSAPRRETLQPVRDEAHHDLAQQPVRPRDRPTSSKWPQVGVATGTRRHVVLSRRCRPKPPGCRGPPRHAPGCAEPAPCAPVGR